MTTKLSYQDALLFYNILDSVRRQLGAAVVIAADLDTLSPGESYLTELCPILKTFLAIDYVLCPETVVLVKTQN